MTLYRERSSSARSASPEYGGRKYHSRFEAAVARDLDKRKRKGEIRDWEPQYQIVAMPYDHEGNQVPELAVRHKVDFRVHLNDGSYELWEAKGAEGDDYKMRRKWLLKLWIPAHRDHEYIVIKDRGRNWTLPKGRAAR